MSKNYKLSHYIFPLMLGFLSMNAIAAINVYGPGGPAPAMHEAAKQFKNKTGIDVHVTAPSRQNDGRGLRRMCSDDSIMAST